VALRQDIPTTCTPNIFVPKAWSPNRDGHNDKLFPFAVCMKEVKYFKVYNRWGQLMFETKNISQGWDGMFNGKLQISDVYTWAVESIGVDGKYYKRSGNSVLLR
jgi:gliding motility-associated-like protein